MGYIPIRNFSEDFPGKKQKPRTELDQARAQLADDASHRHAFSLRNELARFEDEFRQKAGPNSDETPEGLTARAVEYRDKCQHYLGNQTTTPYERGLFDEMAGESKRPWVRHWAQQEARMTVALNQRVAQDAKDAALRDALLNPADFDQVNRLVQAFVVISTKLKTPHEGAEAEINDQVFHKLLDDGLLEAASQRLQHMIDRGMLNEKGSADRQTRVSGETSQQRVDQAVAWLMTETGTDLAQARALTRKAGWGAFLGLTPAEETKAKTLALAALSQSRHLKDKENSEEAKKVWLECGDLAKSGDLAGALERLRKSRAVSDSALEALVERAAAGPPVTYQGTAARVMLGILEGKIRTLDQAVQAGLNLDKIKDASALIDQMGTVKASGRIRMVREKLRELENSYLRSLPDGLKERAGNAFLSSVFHRWNGSKWDDSVGEAVRRASELSADFQLPPARKEDRSHQAINALGNLPSGWFLEKVGAGNKGGSRE